MRYNKIVFNISKIIILSMFFVLAGKPALAFCFEPSFHSTKPMPPSDLSKPSVPFCMQNGGECDAWEVKTYHSAVDDYIQNLEAYSAAAKDYAKSAIRYAEEAQIYSQCEAENIKTQHE